MKKGYYILIIAVSLLLLAATFLLLLEPVPSLVEAIHDSAVSLFTSAHFHFEWLFA